MMKELKKIPKFVLIIDPHSKTPKDFTTEYNIKILSTYNDKHHFKDNKCNKLCDCDEPDMIILLDYVLRFNVGCFKLIRTAEIFFQNEWYDGIIDDALLFYSETEIRNGL